jgi:hypothetical protein
MSVIVGRGSSRRIPDSVQRYPEPASEKFGVLTYWYIGLSLDTAKTGTFLPSRRHQCRSEVIQWLLRFAVTSSWLAVKTSGSR